MKAKPNRQQSLSAAEVRRILGFCLPSGSRVELVEGATICAIHIVSSAEPQSDGRAFEAPTLVEALRAAAAAGVVRAECIERQIAFLTAPVQIRPRAQLAAVNSAPEPASARTGPATPAEPRRGRPVTMSHYRGLAEFRYQVRRFVAFSERAARAAGLEPPQHQLLLAVTGLPPPKRPTLETLAERMGLDVGDCETLVASVCERGLASWTIDGDGPRERLLTVTPAGQSALRKLTELHLDQMLAVGPTFVQALGTVLSGFGEVAPGNDVPPSG